MSDTAAPAATRAQPPSPETNGAEADGALDVLAASYGIEASFLDALGVLQRTPAATKRALLGAMGVRAHTAAEAEAALAALDDAQRGRALPPVLVTLAGAVEIPVVLAPEQHTVAWELRLENGAVETGEAELAVPAPDAEGRRAERGLEARTLRLPFEPPAGYHVLRLANHAAAMRLIVTPGSCWLPAAVLAGEPLSGIALQLYLLRSATNWGIGDFTDLRAVCETVGARGGDVIGLNPLHALFADDPEHASPYSPESRLLLNILNIDVAALPEFAASPALQTRAAEPGFAAALAACRAASLVDYSTVAALKLEMLHAAFDAFVAAPESERRRAFERFRSDASPALAQTFVFAALRAHFAQRDAGRAAWQQWPQAYRDPDAPAVREFAREHAREVEFVAWTQWVADEQLAGAARAAAAMRVGLYRDLAVGADPAGGETWCNARAVVDAARVGAPPDIYNPAGQNWDLPPFDPHALRAEGYASFIELVRANMRHAGGLRIDHVMALARIYWIPRGASPADGAYVRYPLEELVGIIALESHRARCLVVGEDLGTVPAGFRERMAAANILSYRVLFFERDEADEFIPPPAYPPASLAVLGSHDLPTLRAWWSGSDIRLRERLGLFADDAAAQAQLRMRAAAREAFVRALRTAGVIDERSALHGDALFTAAHAFLVRTASAFAVAQLDDITDESDPVNVPTTSDEHPNWRRRYRVAVEELPAHPRLATWITLAGAAGRLRTARAELANPADPPAAT